MTNLATRLRHARKLRNVSQVELAKGSGIKQPTVASLESGRSANSKHLPQIAAYLNVPYEWLLTGKGDLNEKPRSFVDTSIRMVPLRSLSDINSDNPMNSPAQWLPAPKDTGSRTFAVVVEGDAMVSTTGQRTYPEGIIVFVDPDQRDDLQGRRVLARLEGGVALRQYRRELGKIYLTPLNPLYPHVEVENDDAIIGPVVGSYFPE